MLKRVALLGSIAALTISNPSNSVAAVWGAGSLAVAVTEGLPPALERVQFFDDPCCGFPIRRPVVCCRPFLRPIVIVRPVVFPRPRPVAFCCRPFFHRFHHRAFARPPFFWGQNFAPWGFNPYGGPGVVDGGVGGVDAVDGVDGGFQDAGFAGDGFAGDQF
jgi:hypothetical protein